MSFNRLVAPAVAAAIALGSLGIGMSAADAAVVKKPVHHHALVCKKGYAAHKIRVHHHWAWRCQKVVVKRHHRHHPKPMHAVAPKAPMKKP
jgi:hypothetical protein